MLTQEQKLKIFADAKAIITNSHFVYAKKADGWYHGDSYVNKDAIFRHVRSVNALCQDIALHFMGNGAKIEVVVGPTVGGVALSQWVAHHFSAFSPGILSVYADEEDVLEQKDITIKLWQAGMPAEIIANGKITMTLTSDMESLRLCHPIKVGTRRVLKRGYQDDVAEKWCLIVEDIINSGVTVSKVIKAVCDVGGQIAGVACLANRSGGKVTSQTLGVTFLFSLLDLDMKMYPEDSCPICKEKGLESVRTDLGKGKEFLARKGLLRKLQ